MSSLPELKQRLTDARTRYPFLDRVIRTQEHVGETRAGQQAGAVTYFGFVSVFPVLALSFAVVGFVARWYPELQEALTAAIESLLPGMIGDAEHQIQLSDIRENAPGIASIGVLVVLWSGLGWLSAMRTALLVVFALPEERRPNFFIGKLRDLISLAFIGVTMLLTVAIAAVVGGASEWLLDFMPIGEGQEWILKLISVGVGLLANTVLFYALFRLLARPVLPQPSLWAGALLGAIGFEILKQAATYLIAATREQPAFQVFGMALIIVVWIHSFALVLMYAAAWAYTSPAARALRVHEPAEPVQGPGLTSVDELVDVRAEDPRHRSAGSSGAAVLGAAALGAVLGAVVRSRTGRRRKGAE